MKLYAKLSIVCFLVAGTISVVHGEPLRVATFNVNFDNAASDQLVEAIKTADADIVCIQETSRHTFAVLRDRLSDVYPHRETCGEYSFASKLVLREVQFHDDRRCYSASVAIGQQRVRMINAHLSPVLIPERPSALSLLKALHENDERNRAEMAAILELADAAVPTIIVGDFNSVSASKAPSLLRDSGFIDSFAAIHENADSKPTWDWRTMRKLEADYIKEKLEFAGAARDLPLGLRIDYIFHSKHFRTLSSEIVRRGGSDHFLVVSKLNIDALSIAPESR